MKENDEYDEDGNCLGHSHTYWARASAMAVILEPKLGWVNCPIVEKKFSRPVTTPPEKKADSREALCPSVSEGRDVGSCISDPLIRRAAGTTSQRISEALRADTQRPSGVGQK